LSFISLATEIRCEEKSKGGLKYEVILAEPVADRPPSPPSVQSNRPFSEEDIEKKLLAAKERREVICEFKIQVVVYRY
jgi:stathmin